MTAYMLDTDICSYAMKESNPKLLHKLHSVPVSAVCISAITQSELMYGVAVSPRPIKDREALEFFLQHVQVFDYPASAAEIYGQIRGDLKSRGIMIGPNDLLIAAHARALGLTLITNNIREFKRVQGLKVENWA